MYNKRINLVWEKAWTPMKNVCWCCSVAKLCPNLCNPINYRLPLSSTISQSLLKLMSTELVMLSNHLILCFPLLLLPSIFPSIRVFSNGLHIRDSSHQVAKVLEFQLQHQSFQWIFKIDFHQDWLVWSPCSPRDS